MRAAPFICASLCLLAAARTLAQADDRARLMRETIAYTDVIDAFDGEDRFDLNVRLEYERLRERGDLYRERTRADGTREQGRVARVERDLSRVSLGLDVGLFRDLMASLRMPLVLGDARTLRAPSGRDPAQVTADLAGSGGAPLFVPSVASPTRAGLDYVAFGLAYALLNQMRKPWFPTWVIRVEGRRALGTAQRPCVGTSAGRVCGTASGLDRDGDGALDGTRGASNSPGASRGMSALQVETRFSRRYRHVEPYAGFAVLVEWPSLARPLYRAAGAPRARPGTQSTLTLGAALVPWENRGAWQRFVLDLRADASYVGAGYDATPLFDALGSASDPELARGRYQGMRGAPTSADVVPCRDPSQLGCGVGERVAFTGITHVASHLVYGARLGLEVQAARYVRFALGSSLSHVSAHALSGGSPCRAGSPSDPAFAQGDDGRVCTSGSVNTRFRGVIDSPGKRFFLRDQFLLGVFAQATAMF